MKYVRLTIEEHKRLGEVLAIIRNDLGADRLNQYKKGSETQRRIVRARKDVDRLRDKLERALLKDHPRDGTTSIYFGPEPTRERGHAVETLLAYSRMVGDIISGRVLCPVVDQRLCCDRSLCALETAIAERPEDHIRKEAS